MFFPSIVSILSSLHTKNGVPRVYVLYKHDTIHKQDYDILSGSMGVDMHCLIEVQHAMGGTPRAWYIHSSALIVIFISHTGTETQHTDENGHHQQGHSKDYEHDNQWAHDIPDTCQRKREV